MTKYVLKLSFLALHKVTQSPIVNSQWITLKIVINTSNYLWGEVNSYYWRRKWQPTPVLLPGNFHTWRSLVGYSPWDRKESDTTEWFHFLSFYSSFWKGKWQLTPVFLPGESHEWRGLLGFSLWDCKESDTTKQPTDTQSHTLDP